MIDPIQAGCKRNYDICSRSTQGTNGHCPWKTTVGKGKDTILTVLLDSGSTPVPQCSLSLNGLGSIISDKDVDELESVDTINMAEKEGMQLFFSD